MIAIENEGMGIVEAWMRFRHGKARKLSRKIKKKTEAGCVENLNGATGLYTADLRPAPPEPPETKATTALFATAEIIVHKLN